MGIGVARKLTRLTAIGVKTAKPGRYGDGAGLYLLVRSPERRFWIFRYTMGGRTREAGLGPAAGPDSVSLADAREKAAALRRQVKSGIDPLEARQEKTARAAADLQDAKAKGATFRKAAELYVATHQPDWRSDMHRKQWVQSLRDYCFPRLGNLPVQAIEKPHVLAVLQPLWREKPETASRVRGRIERILDFAEASGWRSGDNPARWRRLAVLLGGRRKAMDVTHHAAMPWQQVPAFIAELRARSGVPELALEFLVLTAARTGEVLGAQWREIDLQATTWTVPGSRMKGGRDHRVPLSAAAVTVLRQVAELKIGDFVFPGRSGGLSRTALSYVMKRMGRGREETVHGFRSAFRDWAAEATAYSREVIEMALAHAVGTAVERAYQRSDLIERRRQLADAWADFLARPLLVGEVVPIRK
jgi:integrase